MTHEWWGLNEDIKTMVKDIRARGFHLISIDLFNGSVATNRDEAKTQPNATIATWVDRPMTVSAN